MPEPRYAIHSLLSLWLLAAPAVHAEQQAALKIAAPRSSTLSPRILCDASGGSHPSYAGYQYQTCVRRSCAAAWQRTLESRGSHALTYANYMSRCAPASAKTEATVNAGIPQLIELAYVAAPGAATTTAGATGATAVAAGGIGLTTVLVPVAVLGAIAGGVAAASGSDKPASP